MQKLSTFCTLYIVRHGETDWNKKGLVQGHRDTDLNEEGVSQAYSRASSFKDIHFEGVFASDLSRAKRTAQILVEGRPLTVQTTIALREQFWGEWEGTSFDSIRERFGHDFNAYTGSEKYGVPGVESHFSTAKRVVPFLHGLPDLYQGKNVLVVTHGGVMKAILYHLGHEKYGKVGFKNLDYMCLKVERDNLALDSICGIEYSG